VRSGVAVECGGGGLGLQNRAQKDPVSNQGVFGRTELTSGGLELWLTGIERQWMGALGGGDERGKKNAFLLHGAPFIGGASRGHGEGPRTVQPHQHWRRSPVGIEQGSGWHVSS
jgi:hypothetical protein